MQRRLSVPILTPIAAALAIAFSPTAAGQVTLPEVKVLRAGEVAVSRPAPDTLRFDQTTARAVVDFKSFSVGHGGTVNIVQPSAASWFLGRVVGDSNGIPGSVIAGTVTATGGFALVNPSGIVFTPTARLDVGSLIASTANISTDNFMNGRMLFDDVTNRRGAIVVEGGAEINAAEGGLVALVAPGVSNSGIIRASLGRVALASGHAYTLDLFGDQLVSFAVNDRVTERVTDVDGRPLRSYVEQAGRIEAQQILISANAAKGVLDHVVNMSGVLKATSVAQRGGEIVLSGEDIHVASSGRIDVSGTTGGRAVLIADDHMDFNGIVDARGSSGPGGFVEVSGKKTLAYNGDVLMSAGGSLLFDPTELEINAAMALTLGNTMRAGALATATTSSGDLLVSSPIFGQGGLNGGLTLTAGGSGSVIVDAVIVAGGPVTFNGTTEFRRSVFTNTGNITLNGLGIINPAGDEIGFTPNGSSNNTEVQYSAATFNASGQGHTVVNSGNAWDYISSKITIATGSGSINVQNGLVHFAHASALRNPIASVKWYAGVSVTGLPARSALGLLPIGFIGANLVAGGGGAVNLNGTIGYTNSTQIADAFPGIYSGYIVPSTLDTTFKVLAVGGSLGGNPNGTVNTLMFNSTQNPAIGTLAYNASDPNHNGQLVPPAPTSANAGSAAAYISELNLVAPASSSTTAAANSATQEANAIANSIDEGQADEGQSSSESGGRGPSQTADLGRGGSSSDVFGQNFHVASGAGAGPNADAEYFSETPFQSAQRRRQQQ